MTSAELPAAAGTLLRKLEGWTTCLTCASGQLAFGGLSKEPGADGKRHRVSTVETVDSVLIKALHADGRGLVVLWIRRPGASWKFDMAWTARRAGQLAPSQVNSRELVAYVALEDQRQLSLFEAA
jgi:hypothetical protein